MRKHYIYWGVVVGVLCLCGCATVAVRPSHAGKYYSTRDLQHFTMLKSDGTFLVNQKKGEFSGHYNVQSNTLLLTLDSEDISLVGHIHGRTVVDNNGVQWIRPQYSFNNSTVRKESLFEMHSRLPEGWLLRFWQGRYFICKRPKGPPPPSLDADAVVIILSKGKHDALANAQNMIAEIPEHTIHMYIAPSKELWPNATEDLLKLFIKEDILQ